MALLLTVPLFFLIDIYPPYGMGMLFLIAKMLFSGVVIFLIFMATMWNSIERNGILSTKLSMEMARTALAHYDNRPYFDDNSCSQAFILKDIQSKISIFEDPQTPFKSMPTKSFLTMSFIISKGTTKKPLLNVS